MNRCMHSHPDCPICGGKGHDTTAGAKNGMCGTCARWHVRSEIFDTSYPEADVRKMQDLVDEYGCVGTIELLELVLRDDYPTTTAQLRAALKRVRTEF